MALRVGVIGVGIMGSDHARQLHRFVSGAEVCALTDIDAGRAQAVAAQIPGARGVADPLAVIAAEDVDAVVIASHDSTHAELVRACATAKKPVLCEKPLTPALSDSIEVLRDIGLHAQHVSLGFMRRFDPGAVALRSAIQAGDLGTPLLVHSVGRGVSSGPGTTSETAVTNSAIHDLDFVPWLLGSPVRSVSWQAPERRVPGIDFADPMIILLRTADGALSTVEIFLNARYGYDVRCEVVGSDGAASFTEPAVMLRDAALGRTVGYAADWRPRYAEAYRLELQAWVDRCRGSAAAGAGQLATAQDGLTASAVADAVIESMHSDGRFVDVSVPAV